MGRLAILLCSVLVALTCMAGFSPVAFAAEESNLVNTQQVPDSSFVYDTEIADLSGSDSYFENQTVQITGEVVGDRINSEEDPSLCWITVQELGKGDATVQVYLTKEQSEQIDSYGKYEQMGSTVQVMGNYHLACSAHAGLSDIHATSLNVTEPGHSTAVPFDPRNLLPGAALCIVGGSIWFYYYRSREEQR